MKIDNPGPQPRFDAKQVARILEAQGRLDASEAYFFARELEQIMVEQFDVKKAALKARLFVPQDTSIDPGADIVTYTQYESFGKAKRIKDFGDDVPMVGLNGEQFPQKMQSYGLGFNYSIGELRAAAKAGRPLERDRVDAVRRGIDQAFEDVAATGDADAGLYGLLNITAADTFTATNKTGGGTAWSGALPDEILADLNGMVRQVKVNTKEVENISRILLPTEQYEIISNTARSSTSDTTILGFFLGNNPGIEVMSWERLSTAGSGGVTRMVGYNPDRMLVRQLVAVDFEMLAPQQVNMSYKVIAHMRTGGVISPYPKSICYSDSI